MPLAVTASGIPVVDGAAAAQLAPKTSFSR